MRKKRSGGGGASWMDTYGDMVTLLLCFFVLLYSMSSISEEKFKALVMSFNPDAAQTVTQTSGNDGPNADPNEEDGSGMGLSPAQIDQNMENLYEEMSEYIQSLGMGGSVSVTQGEGKVFITFDQSVFFNGDDWQLRDESLPILEHVGEMISNAADSIDEVRVLGHTAQANLDRPNSIITDRMLSAQRAANALAYIQEHCTLDPARMISEGYGQWRPIATNDTPEGRAKNRRVEIIISSRDMGGDELQDSVQEYYTERGTADPAQSSASETSSAAETGGASASRVSSAPAG
ncbi:MAG: flagellar motor protein MotB [Acutalibacter sp.]